MLIGQRGNDQLYTGGGNDLAIGDAGSNKIATNIDTPRIIQIYRFLSSPADYAPNATDFGFAFMNDFDLYPYPFRYVDAGASIIDQVIAFDDFSDRSNVVRDIVGISGSISTTDGAYCLYPMFRVSPGFLSATDMLHGDDSKYCQFSCFMQATLVTNLLFSFQLLSRRAAVIFSSVMISGDLVPLT